MRNFVKGISFLRTMDSNKVKGFFYPGNAVSGEPDYRFAEFFVRSAEAFANLLHLPISLTIPLGSCVTKTQLIVCRNISYQIYDENLQLQSIL